MYLSAPFFFLFLLLIVSKVLLCLHTGSAIMDIITVLCSDLMLVFLSVMSHTFFFFYIFWIKLNYSCTWFWNVGGGGGCGNARSWDIELMSSSSWHSSTTKYNSSTTRFNISTTKLNISTTRFSSSTIITNNCKQSTFKSQSSTFQQQSFGIFNNDNSTTTIQQRSWSTQCFKTGFIERLKHQSLISWCSALLLVEVWVAST